MNAPYTPFYCEENVYQLLLSLSRQTSSPSSRLYAAFITNPARHALLFQQKASRQDEDQAHYVLWDYHVIALLALGEEDEGKKRVVVLDRDTRLVDMVDLEEYFLETFRPDLFSAGVLDPSLRSRIRLVPAAEFLANFASDRSHMDVEAKCSPQYGLLRFPVQLVPPATALDASPLPSSSSFSLTPSPSLSASTASPAAPPQYQQPPPPYPPLCGPSAKARGETHNLWTRWLDVRLPSERAAVEGKDGTKGEEEEGEWEGFGVVLERPEELLTYRW